MLDFFLKFCYNGLVVGKTETEKMVFDENESWWEDFWTRHAERVNELVFTGQVNSWEEAKAQADKEFELED